MLEELLREVSKPAKAVVKSAPVAPTLLPAVPTVQAPTVVIPSRINKLKETVRQSKGDYGARRVERAADEIPNLEALYNEQALRSAFKGDNAKALMTMNPADFEQYAAPIPRSVTNPDATRHQWHEILDDGRTLTFSEYIDHLKNLKGFRDVPFLVINKEEQGLPLIPFLHGHEGRHRNRAMTESGEQAGLVQLFPEGELREPFSRRDQEEYLDSLKKELGLTDNLVLPEKYTESGESLWGNQIQRPAIKLPDIYAEGGEVHMMGGGRPPKKTTLEEDLKSFKDPAIGLADLLAGALRGTTTAATGIAGDLEELYRQFGKGAVANAVRLMLPKREGKATTFPTIEEMNAMLPPVVPAGAGRSTQVANVGQFLGENNPLAPTAIAAVKPVVKAVAPIIKAGALDLARSEPARRAVNQVMRATGSAPMSVVPVEQSRSAIPAASKSTSTTVDPYQRSLEQGYNHDWFHGTTGDIKSFDPRFLGESTNANSAKKGFFFARDPKSPPEHLKVKSNDPEAIELLRRFGMSDEDIAKNNTVSFEGHGSSTASDYAGLGGSRDYKEAMRNAALAEKRGDWDAYDKFTQEAEASVFGERDYRQGLVAKHGDARDQLLHSIDQAFSYGRPEVYKNMSQEDLTNLDKTRQQLMPYSWYMHENAPFEKILEEASKYGTESQLQNLAEEIKNFKSVTNERRLGDVEQGANVLPVALRYKNPYVHDFGGASYRDESYSDLIDKALAGDHDALLLLNTFDPGGGKPKMIDVGVVFDPSQIRSRFAEFNPEHLESSDILKKSGGAVMMADGGVITIEEFLRKQGY
jgi:hypothetical protein